MVCFFLFFAWCGLPLVASLFLFVGVRLRVVGVADSKSLLISSDVFTNELDDQIPNEICRVKQSGSPLSTLGSGLVVVDCSATAETVETLKKMVDIGRSIVLADKKPFTSSMEYFDKLMSHPCRIWHESTVGAGLPVIVSVNSLLSSGDTVRRVFGSLNATIGQVKNSFKHRTSCRHSRQVLQVLCNVPAS